MWMWPSAMTSAPELTAARTTRSPPRGAGDRVAGVEGEVGLVGAQLVAVVGEVRAAVGVEGDERGVNVELVADEWCNTVDDVRAFVDAGAGHMIQIKTPDLGSLHNTADAVLYCKEKGVGAYMGGTCNETNRSAETCVHVAMAMNPDQILAKPGMGVDEGVMIVYNEMQRILALRGQKLNYTIGPRRAGDVVAVYADNTKAAVRLGWNCQYNLEDAMLSAWNWELKMKELEL